MTKRYREEIDEVELAPVPGAAEVTAGYASGSTFDGRASEGRSSAGVGGAGRSSAPARFRWRGRRYQVTSVLGHWYEDAGWWRRTDGVPERIERTDLWRVEAGDRRASGPGFGNGARNGVGYGARNGAGYGVYELVRRGDVWRLDRVWD